MRNKMFSRITMASLLGIGVVTLAFACDPEPTPNPTPVADLSVIPADMTVLPDLTLLNPTATQIAPARGPGAGNTAITITGTDFKSGATVMIGGVAATNVVVVSPTQITANTGASTMYGPQDVVVDNKDGSTTATLAKSYTYFIGNLTFATGANANTAVMGVNGPRGISAIDLSVTTAMPSGNGFPSIVAAMGTANVMGMAQNGINLIPNTTAAPTNNAPTFAATQGIGAAGVTNAISTTVADMDNNGQLDVIVTFQNTNAVVILHRMGAGAPTPTLINAATGGFNQPSFTVVGDFDGDGKKDLAVTNQAGGTGTVSILRQSGNMTYAQMAGSPVAMGAGYGSYGIDAADFNGDKRTDLVVGNVANNTNLRIILNNVASWAAQPLFGATILPGAGPNVVKAGDWDGDGKMDFISVNRNGGNVTFYKGNDTGAFTRPNANIAVGTAPEIAAVGDLNRDGFMDLVVPNFGSSNAHLLIGRGDGTFNNPVVLPAGAQPNGVAIGDYNNDGRPDIAMSVFNGGNVQIHRNTGTN